MSQHSDEIGWWLMSDTLAKMALLTPQLNGYMLTTYGIDCVKTEGDFSTRDLTLTKLQERQLDIIFRFYAYQHHLLEVLKLLKCVEEVDARWFHLENEYGYLEGVVEVPEGEYSLKRLDQFQKAVDSVVRPVKSALMYDMLPEIAGFYKECILLEKVVREFLENGTDPLITVIAEK